MLDRISMVFVTLLIRFLWSDLCWCQRLTETCDEEYFPENCDLPDLPLSSLNTVEDFERCAPALLSVPARNYFWGGTGREFTVRENQNAYKRIRILNRVLRDVSHNWLSTKVLGQRMSFPVGLSPTAAHELADPDGEIATARAAASMDTVMILSSLATRSLEEVADNFRETSGHLWMQVYIFINRLQTVDMVRRAERMGFEAIVVTVDSPIPPKFFCDSRGSAENKDLPNFFNHTLIFPSPSITFKDLAWLCRMTRLPVVAKGILTARDAMEAARAGVSAILVSNHGGRQLDSTPATIDALPAVADAMQKYHPGVEVFVDGGVKNGIDVFKALMRGARAVFVGRPIIWGLTAGGEEGVAKVLSILKREFNETMLVAGYNSPQEIYQEHRSLMEFHPQESYP